MAPTSDRDGSSGAESAGGGGDSGGQGNTPAPDHTPEDAIRPASVFVFTQDLSLRYTWIFNPQHPAAAESSSCVGKTDEELFAPQIAERLTELKRKVLADGKGARSELSVQSADDLRIYEVTLEPIRDRAGTISGITGASVDVTERRQADRQIRLLAQTVASTRDAVLIADLDGRLLFINESFLQMFGYAEEEVLGKDISIGGAPAPGTPPRREIASSSGRGGYQGESLGIRKDGSSFPLEVWTSVVRNDEDEPVAIVAVARDVTARKQAERVQTATYRIAAAVNTTENLRDLYRAIHEIIGDLMPARNFYIAVMEEGSGLLTFPYFVDEMDEPPAPRPPGKGLTEYVVRTGEPLLASPEVFHDLIERGAAVEMGAPSLDWLGVPLIAGSRAFGALVVQSYSPGVRFRAEHREILTFVSTQIAMAIDRKRADEALRENERRYRSLYNNTPVMLHSIDNRGRLLSVSDYWLRVMGYAREEVIGRPSTDFLTEASRRYAQMHILPEFFKTGYCTNVPYELVTKDGRVIDITLSAIAERDQEGHVVRSLAVLQDVTERNRAEQALLQSEQRYRGLFEDSAVALREEDASDLKMHLDMLRESGHTDLRAYFAAHPAEVLRCKRMVKLVDVNRATLELYGARTKEEFREYLPTIYGEEGILQYAEEIASLAEGHAVYMGETVTRRIDGRLMNVVVRVSVAPGHERCLSRVIASTIDISERKFLQQQLLQAQKLESLGTLAGGIAHDFNNLLGIILGHASLLPEVASDEPRLKRSIAAIHKAADRGASLVRQILTFARKADVKFEPVSLNDVVAELGRMLEETFPRTIAIALDLDSTLPLIDADRTQVHQTLLNLCVNARDAMPEGGMISISTRLAPPAPPAELQEPRYVCLTVADSGAGMDEETKRRIFEPFFTTKELGKGTGLGLSVVYGIVEAHGGYITVDSSPGKGTRFQLYFPIPAVPSAAETAAEVIHADVAGGTETLLIAEDEPLLCDLLKATLEGAGYTVLAASDGEQAVSMFETFGDDIALVITDIGLPRMSGRDVFLRIRTLQPTARVLIATGYIDPEAKTELLSLGASGFLQKPYLPEEVARSVREILHAPMLG
ncbi:MAG: PAS domain S-box protein [Bacteroidota bacterium]